MLCKENGLLSRSCAINLTAIALLLFIIEQDNITHMYAILSDCGLFILIHNRSYGFSSYNDEFFMNG